jgi:hypothetical protein
MCNFASPSFTILILCTSFYSPWRLRGGPGVRNAAKGSKPTRNGCGWPGLVALSRDKSALVGISRVGRGGGGGREWRIEDGGWRLALLPDKRSFHENGLGFWRSARTLKNYKTCPMNGLLERKWLYYMDLNMKNPFQLCFAIPRLHLSLTSQGQMRCGRLALRR